MAGVCDVHRFPFWLIYKDVLTVTIATAANLAWCPPLSFNSSLMSVHGIAVIYDREWVMWSRKNGALNLSCKAKSSQLSLRAQPIAVKQTPSHIAIIFLPLIAKDFGHDWRSWSHRKAMRQHVWGKKPLRKASRNITTERDISFHFEDRRVKKAAQISDTIPVCDVTVTRNTVWPCDFESSLLWTVVVNSSVNSISTAWQPPYVNVRSFLLLWRCNVAWPPAEEQSVWNGSARF